MLPLHYGPSCSARALIAAEQGSASASPDRSTIVAHAGGAVNPLTGFILATGYAEYLETLDGLPPLDSSVHLACNYYRLRLNLWLRETISRPRIKSRPDLCRLCRCSAHRPSWNDLAEVEAVPEELLALRS